MNNPALVVAGRAGKVEWTRIDTVQALRQGWGLFTNDRRVMRVLRVADSEPLSIEARQVFHSEESARAWVKQRAMDGSDLHRRAWALDGKTNRQVQDENHGLS